MPSTVQIPVAPLRSKSTGAAYFFMLFTLIGLAGIQHFYLGKYGRGILWLLTWGLLGIGTFVDVFTLPSQTKTVNARRAVGIR
ncbi:TM2 domain-containing protein [Diaminobutyricibacter tongyongensis]|uniref:TM2 domain-containing protein n=1 Tax=Leifsonia tongyongensis TaxID=1268043 RepID=A0A6L9XT57_9MICO|nr:NINE protein [Diaminobutyricibacter tongyongensis]NEN04559.1 TM2 domain-containing protein [Diaminobutyricibacter tongyongensis]